MSINSSELENLGQTEKGYREVLPFPKAASGGRSFVSGNKESDILRIHYFQNIETKEFKARAWFGPGTEGPPGVAHGGSLAAVLDEVMGAEAWNSGYPVVAAKLEVEFKKSLPLGTVAQISTKMTSIEGRKIQTYAELKDSAGELYCTGKALFIVLKPERISEFKKKLESSSS